MVGPTLVTNKYYGTYSHATCRKLAQFLKTMTNSINAEKSFDQTSLETLQEGVYQILDPGNNLSQTFRQNL